MNIARWLPLLILGLPIAELIILAKLVGALGLLLTLAILLGTAAAGMTLLRAQGFSTVLRLREALERGQLPAREILEGGLLALGGLLLALPGFLSDVLALACLIPVLRRRVADYLLRHSVDWTAQSRPPSADRNTIEGEFKRED